MANKIVVSVSGGLDSVTAMYLYHSEGREVEALSMSYGQKGFVESKYAKLAADRLGIPYTRIIISSGHRVFKSALTSWKIPLPETEYVKVGLEEVTVVPNRNAVFGNIAASLALSLGYDAIALGVHGSDYAVFPDCRPEFIEQLEELIYVANGVRVRVLAPFLDWPKSGIIILGAELGVPFEDTWSCYYSRPKHCGVCGSCRARKQAFIEAGIEDPTEYEVS